MIAAAYAYAVGGIVHNEFLLVDYIDHYGVETVTGRRTLGYWELNQITLAKNIVAYCKERDSSQDWVGWARANPDKSKILDVSRSIAIHLGYIDG